MADFNYCEPWAGVTSGIATSPVLKLPRLINNYTIVNKTAGAVGVSVYLIGGVAEINISEVNKQISAGGIYENEVPRVMLATQQIKVQASGSVSYDFTLSNIEMR